MKRKQIINEHDIDIIEIYKLGKFVLTAISTLGNKYQPTGDISLHFMETLVFKCGNNCAWVPFMVGPKGYSKDDLIELFEEYLKNMIGLDE